MVHRNKDTRNRRPYLPTHQCTTQKAKHEEAETAGTADLNLFKATPRTAK